MVLGSDAVDGLEMATAERTDLADLLETLTPRQWEAPSLCQGWRVRDVVAHVMKRPIGPGAELWPRHLGVRARFALPAAPIPLPEGLIGGGVGARSCRGSDPGAIAPCAAI